MRLQFSLQLPSWVWQPMQQIHVPMVPTYVLSPDTRDPKFIARREAVLAGLQQYDFAEIQVVKGVYAPTDGVPACAMGHGLAIEQALSARPFKPFLILEDDALIEAGRPLSIEVPDDADACYLGISSFGSASNASLYTHAPSGILYSETRAPRLARVYNMLSTHAIFVLREEFARNWLRCAVEATIRRNCPVDVLLARTHPYYNTYALRSPMFYQAQALGGLELATRPDMVGCRIDGPHQLPPRIGYFEAPSSAVDFAMLLKAPRHPTNF